MKKFLVFVGAAIMAHGTAMAQFSNQIQHFNSYDQKGIHKFETGKNDTIPFDGMKLRLGAAFTQQFQALEHKSTANFNQSNSANSTKLYPISPGFMQAQANLFIDAQLADGIRLNVASYMSARHHNEFWVKGGYLQIDKLPFNAGFLNDLMKYTTIKIGQYETNYGDMHYRRSDGGHTLQNPFMEGYILDAFSTEIGGDVFVQKNGFFGMVGLTSGMLRGNIDSVKTTVANPNAEKQPSLIFKGGVDKQLTNDLRVRFSGSYYHNGNTGNGLNTLYWGDRTGSNYQNAMEKWGTYDEVKKVWTPSASTATAWSGRLNPGFSQQVDAVMLNGFIKYQGFEFFGTYEKAKGRSATEAVKRSINQYAADLVYRFGPTENLFVGARYNVVEGQLAFGAVNQDIQVNRTALSAGWFLTKNILLKGEYVKQQYKDFPTADYRSGGQFNGVVVEAAISF